MVLKVFHFAIVLFLIGAVCVAGINMVFNSAKENIEKQMMDAKMGGIRTAFGFRPTAVDEVFVDREIKDENGQNVTVYEHKNGYAIESSAQGYDSVVKLIVAVSKDFKNVIGISVIEQGETPGFGSRIVAAPITMTIFGGKVPGAEEMFIPPFQEGYYGLEIKMLDSAKGVQELAKNTEVDAISGATITSNAVMVAVKNGVDRLRSLKVHLEKDGDENR